MGELLVSEVGTVIVPTDVFSGGNGYGKPEDSFIGRGRGLEQAPLMVDWVVVVRDIYW